METLEMLFKKIGERKNAKAIHSFHEEEKEEWSFGEMDKISERLSAGLRQQYGKDPKKVVLFAENSARWVCACFGVLRAGYTVLPLDVQLSGDVLEKILKDSEAEILFASKKSMRILQKIKTKHKIDIYLLSDKNEKEKDGVSWQKLLDEGNKHERDFQPVDFKKDSLACLFYTSGTTGVPKGVELTQLNLAFQIEAVQKEEIVGKSDRLLLPLPLHHVYPFVVGLLACLFQGVTLIFPKSLTGPELNQAMKRGRATVILGVPRIYEVLDKAIDSRVRSRGRLVWALFQAVLSFFSFLTHFKIRWGQRLFAPLRRQLGPDLRLLASGGSAIKPGLVRRFEALGLPVTSGYGLTETSPLLTINPAYSGKHTSAGRALPKAELKIDESSGEVLAKSPGVFSRYHHQPEQTKEVFKGDWFRTGDLGHFDKDGYLYLTGRASTLIVMPGGKNIQPDEVEEKYSQSRVIREAGVLQHKDRLTAVLVSDRRAAKGSNGKPEETVRREAESVSRSLPSYQRISDFVVTPEPLPRTRLGKIKRHELEKLYKSLRRGKPKRKGPVPLEELSPEDRELLKESPAREIWDWFVAHFPDDPLRPDTDPGADLGIDSLEWMNITMEISEQTGIQVSEEDLAASGNLRELCQRLRDQKGSGKKKKRHDPVREPEKILKKKDKKWLRLHNAWESAIVRVVYAFIWAGMRLYFRLGVKSHVPPKEFLEKNFLLVSNHNSYLDPLALIGALPFKVLRKTHSAGWTGVAFGNPVFRFFSRLALALPIDPKRHGISSLALAAAALKQEHNLIWFPEGRRSPSGKLEEFKPGIKMLVGRLHPEVIPVWIEGTYEALPVGAFFPKPVKITVYFGKPFRTGNVGENKAADLVRERLKAVPAAAS